jgi:eukaryotic-like serine/threonine-protein kinase
MLMSRDVEPPVDSLKPGAVVVARYRLDERVPSDLLGVDAWDATDQILDRPVHVSVITGSDATLTLDAARRAALVSDEHIARVIDVLHDASRNFVVTEPHVGATLADLVEGHPLNAHAARAIIGEAASALEAARRRGVHHGALRPAALRISQGSVRVIGLGIDGGLVASDQVTKGDDASRADTVALVGLLHYALTGVLRRVAYDAAALDPAIPNPPGLQVDGEVFVPPRDLESAVPNDLDTLCSVTLNGHDDGPTTPGELVTELAPWDKSAVPMAGPVPASARSVDSDYPTEVNRQSVRQFGADATPSVGASMPGTPPPAGPVRRPTTGRIPRVSAATTVGAAAVGSAATASAEGSSASANPTGAALPAAAATAGGAATASAATGLASGGGATFSAVQGGSAQVGSSLAGPTQTTGARAPSANAGGSGAAGGAGDGTRQWNRPASSGNGPAPAKDSHLRFNPTAVVLIGMLLLVIVAGYMAKNTLFGGYGPVMVQPEGRPTTSVPADPNATDSPASEDTSPTSAPPIVASGQEVTLPGDSDHPETASLAYDNDTTTAWYSLEYKTATFGGLNRQLGYAITLEQPTTVSGIFLTTANEGGNVEVRATDAANATTGEVLASGPLTAETTLTFTAPVETQNLVIMITEVPSAPEGKFRAHFYEIAPF